MWVSLNRRLLSSPPTSLLYHTVPATTDNLNPIFLPGFRCGWDLHMVAGVRSDEAPARLAMTTSLAKTPTSSLIIAGFIFFSISPHLHPESAERLVGGPIAVAITRCQHVPRCAHLHLSRQATAGRDLATDWMCPPSVKGLFFFSRVFKAK